MKMFAATASIGRTEEEGEGSRAATFKDERAVEDANVPIGLDIFYYQIIDG